MSRSIPKDMVFDNWKEAFKCPKCEDGHLRMKNEGDILLVCDKCGHRKPFIVDNKKSRWIIDG